MPARVAARSPVHIFSTPTASTVGVPAAAARVARWRAEAPPAQELSTLTMPALRSPACGGRSGRGCIPGRAAGRRWRCRTPRGRRRWPSTPASARASRTTASAISAAAPVAPVHGRRGGADDAYGRSTGLGYARRRHAGRRQGAPTSALELVEGLVVGHVEGHVLGAGLAIGGHPSATSSAVPLTRCRSKALGGIP